jgi:hypothetical protein
MTSPAAVDVEHALSGPFTPQWGKITLSGGTTESSCQLLSLGMGRAFCLESWVSYELTSLSH